MCIDIGSKIGLHRKNVYEKQSIRLRKIFSPTSIGLIFSLINFLFNWFQKLLKPFVVSNVSTTQEENKKRLLGILVNHSSNLLKIVCGSNMTGSFFIAMRSPLELIKFSIVQLKNGFG